MINLRATLKSLRKLRHAKTTPTLSAGQRLYCIGDIHGRYDLLLQLHEKTRQDSAQFQGRVIVVYLGDYIDRGPDSKAVIDYLLASPLPSFECHYLMGNHEQVLLEFLLTPDAPHTELWLNFGGLSTLASYGVALNGIPHSGQIPDLRQAMQQKLPSSHLSFLQQLQPYFEIDDYYFVHAGIRPGVKLKQQQIEDQLWIRTPFLNHRRYHGKMIVHGHTITETPDIQSNRIGIDTGAYSSNTLTCLVLEEQQIRFLSTSPD